MGELAEGQVQTLSMRMTTGLRGRLEAIREMASLRRGGAPVTTSEVAKGLLETARHEGLELLELQTKPTQSLLAIRKKVEHGQLLTLAEWMLVARYVQVGTESFHKNPLRPASWAGLLEAFQALYGVRLTGPDQSGVYLGQLRGWSTSVEGGTEQELRHKIGHLLDQARAGQRVHPSIGRALYGVLAGEQFPGVEAIQEVLTPYWPVLWRVAARGHYGQQKSAICEQDRWEDDPERHPGTRTPGHSEGIPIFYEGEYKLSFAQPTDRDMVSLLLSFPGDHGPMYSLWQYPKIAEFRAMLEDLGPRAVDQHGNVRGDGLWDGEAFFGYVVSGSTAEGYWFRDGAISLGFPLVGWQQVRELFRKAWEHPEVARVWTRLEQEYGEL